MSARIALASGSLASGPQPLVRGSVILRPWADADAHFLAEAFADPDIARWHSHASSDPQEWIQRRSEYWASETGGDWAIEDGGTTSGRVALHHVDLLNGSAEVGYWVHPARRGRGIARRAVETLVTWAFDLGFHRVQLEHSVANLPSCRVAERCGFALEGIARSSTLHADGWHDMHVHGRINPEHAGD